MTGASIYGTAVKPFISWIVSSHSTCILQIYYINLKFTDITTWSRVHQSYTVGFIVQ